MSRASVESTAMSGGRFTPVVGLVLALLVWAGQGEARGLYKYIDAEGVMHFSDTPVDRRYRRMKPMARQDGIAITPRRSRRVPTEKDYDRLIAQVSREHGIQPALTKAVIAAESNFKPDAVSRVGAQGLMQLMPATAAELGVERPFGVVDNIDGGVRYLRSMLDRYGDVTRALAAYNAGPTTVDRYEGVPPYKETQAYVERVLEYYRRYWSDFESNPEPVAPETRLTQTGVGLVGPASPAAVGSGVRYTPRGRR